jgi:two-component system response regulator AtoC
MIELDFTRYPVLVVDDEQDNLDAFRFAFRKSFALTYAEGGADALRKLETLDAAVVVTDQRMPGMSGIELLRQALQLRPHAVGVLLTAYTDLPLLLESINSGAVYRYVQKPWNSKELTVILRQSIERFHRQRENRSLREQLARYAGYLETEQRDPLAFGELATESPAIRSALVEIEALAPTAQPVLVAGEPGTEKELFARALHVGSPREARPFVLVSCPALDDRTFEREIFGWQKDAFAGANAARPGKLELADGGTLVLAELRRLGPATAERLSEFLASARFRSEGGDADRAGDVRVVVTTSETPEDFRARGDLYAQLGASSVVVPPLRARLDDLPGLCQGLLVHHAARFARPARGWSQDALARLVTYRWPGNLAELSTVVQRAVLLCPEPQVGPGFVLVHDVDTSSRSAAAASPIDLPGQLDDLERRELCSALERCHRNKAEVARMLGIQRTTLYYRLKRLGIEA